MIPKTINNLKKNIFLVLIMTATMFVVGCGPLPEGIGSLTMDVSYETEDDMLNLDSVPSDATEPAEGFHTNVPRGTDLSLKATEGSPIEVVSWVIKDHFGSNTIKQIESSGEFKINVNHQIVAQIVCVEDEVCLGDYVCVDNACVSAN